MRRVQYVNPKTNEVYNSLKSAQEAMGDRGYVVELVNVREQSPKLTEKMLENRKSVKRCDE